MKNLILSLTLISTAALAHPVDGNRPIPDDEMTIRFMEGQTEETSLERIQALNLNSATTALDLWSGSYWPHYQGSLAVRYREAHFISLMQKKAQWKDFKEAFEKQPLYVFAGSEEALSPAEKYDLVAGDNDMTLTKYSWEVGKKTASSSGTVPTWRGVCDGWSSASQKMPRPVKAVTLKTSEGRPVVFYPEDIKALGSLSYARSQSSPAFLGKRCVSPLLALFTNACDGTNPGALHRALVNRVGKLHKSFIADVSPGSEVWNYPVKNYKFTFYNPFDMEVTYTDFKTAMEPFGNKKHFRASDKRHKNTSFIVGVKAEVAYADMREANLSATDSQEADKVLNKVYYYDLELDSRFNILGGEWATNDQPDFIWAPMDSAYPLSDEEEKGVVPMTPADIAKMAKAASKVGQPLSVIIQQLFELAK